MFALMSKWYHTLVGFLQGCLFVVNPQIWLQILGLASCDDYLFKLAIAIGACAAKDSSKPLGPQAVTSLLSIVEDPACHFVYFDYFLHLIL